MEPMLTDTGQQNLSGQSNRHRGSSISRITIEANGTTGIPAFGVGFYIVASTAEVKVKTDKTVFKQYKQGTGEEFTNELEFQRLEFVNPNAFSITVDIWYGFGRYIDRRFELLDAPTAATASAATLAASGTEDFNGVPSANQLRRKYAIITNLNTSNALTVNDLDGNPMATIFPEQNFVLDSSAGFQLENNTGAGIAYQVAEIWYVNTQV